MERYLADEPRDRLDPILDHCVEVYEGLIIEDQIEFKSCAKTFVRTYNFLSAILPYGSVQWEKLSIFLNLLIPKLPKPEGEDYTEGLLEDVDLESYRAEAQQTMRIQLENENGEIDPEEYSERQGTSGFVYWATLQQLLEEGAEAAKTDNWSDFQAHFLSGSAYRAFADLNLRSAKGVVPTSAYAANTIYNKIKDAIQQVYDVGGRDAVLALDWHQLQYHICEGDLVTGGSIRSRKNCISAYYRGKAADSALRVVSTLGLTEETTLSFPTLASGVR